MVEFRSIRARAPQRGGRSDAAARQQPLPRCPQGNGADPLIQRRRCTSVRGPGMPTPQWSQTRARKRLHAVESPTAKPPAADFLWSFSSASLD